MIRVLLADDDPLVRMGLRLMFGSVDDITIVAEAADGEQAVALSREHTPDVVLLDIRMPVMDGLAATPALRSLPSPPAIVILTTFNPDEYVVRALRAGAAGFLLKDTPPADIMAAVHRVAAGEPVLSPAVTQQLIARVADPASEAAGTRSGARIRLGRLAAREYDVALAVGQGRTNAEIAARLYMSIPTVKAHVSSILAKLDVTNRVQVALIVHDAGLGRPSAGD
ncbi:response regulator transcription factor [Streptomyces sp. BR123]|uniref:response regulator n=1 Tax=Streptomyces sp. BR123 TaxID=2749828 RepID=UPI00211B5B15|nr:response regulator transcription factor [Streptomyces sp. BR123]